MLVGEGNVGNLEGKEQGVNKMTTELRTPSAFRDHGAPS